MSLQLQAQQQLMASEVFPQTLEQWLDHISAVHPREIELGLARIKAVASNLSLPNPARKTITVAGTNGKGTSVACLESLLETSGFSTAAYTSPHLHEFNERIRVRGKSVGDSEICHAFSAIEQARGDTSLSYFEFATLAALWVFSRHDLDFALLEVGLGGRLDAVNMIDPDIALITSISLDHQDWLGSDLEVIGFEKAGIMRSAVPAVFADYSMPESIARRAGELDCPLYALGQEFDYIVAGRESDLLEWSSKSVVYGSQSPNLRFAVPSELHYGSLAACLQVLLLLEIPLEQETVTAALKEIQLPGRFERRIHPESGRRMILDVAHNPAAAQLLSERLEKLWTNNPQQGRVIAVLAVLDDKDIEGIVVSLQSCVDIWYIAQLDDQRGLSVDQAIKRLGKAFPGLSCRAFGAVEAAFESACIDSGSNDWVVVAGSFLTVAIAREHSRAA